MALTPPPDMDLTEDLGPRVIREVAACSVLAFLSVVGRLFSKRAKKAPLSASDYTIIAGLLGALTASGLSIWDAKLGLGKHIYVVPPMDLRQMLITVFVEEIFYSLTLPLIKISILFLYHSLFPGKFMKLACYVIGAFTVAWAIAILLVAIFSCDPVHGFWDGFMMNPPPKCIDNTNFFIGNSVPNIVADVAILCLPVREVLHLKMTARTKAAVLSMFLLGGFIIIASCVRLVFLLQIDMQDVTYSYYGVVVWSCVEMDVAVVCACLPTMRPLLQAVWPSALARKLYASGSNSKGAKTNSKDTYFKMSPRRQYGEEFHRLPEETGNTMTSGSTTDLEADRTVHYGNVYSKGTI